MAGLVNSTKKRININKRVKEVEIPSSVLNTSLFIGDLNTVGANAIQSLTLAELGLLPTIVKNEAVTALVCGAYKEGKVFGMSGDTKSIEEFDFTRNSSGTRTNAAGLIELVAPNIPRINYDPENGQLLGYLLEPASTNNYLWSGMGNYGSNFNLINTSNKSRCALVTESSRQCIKVTLGSVFRLASVNVKSSTKYVISFYIKVAQNFRFQIRNSDGTGGYNPVGYDVPANKWTRIVHRFTTRATTTNELTYFYNDTDIAADLPEFFIADFQLEEGELATSYIPTTDAIATRLADTIKSKRDIVSFKEGCIYVNGSFESPVSDASTSNFIYKDLSKSRYLYILVLGSVQLIRTYNGTSTVDVKRTEVDFSKTSKFAIAYSKTQFSITSAGMTRSATGTFGETADLLTIQAPTPCHIRSLAILQRNLSNSELVTLTT